MSKLTEKGNEFVWGKGQATALEVLKGRLISAPIPADQVPKRAFILDINASDVGIGAVRKWEQDGQEKGRSQGRKKILHDLSRTASLCALHETVKALSVWSEVYHQNRPLSSAMAD